ncbi:MAG TPA: PAS-domain containing protein [Ferrovibrio sp.]|uniref:PAS domain-containing sensor histidine kinase n=1 Tax=Ferrovibrio sp. TaxID=1917215 RepID=UPI002ED59959
MLQLPFKLTEDEARIFAWTGEFRDHRQERRYREQRIETIRAMLRACGIAGTGSFCLLIIRDYLVQGPNIVFYWDLVLRSIGLLTGIVFQLVVARATTTNTLHAAATAGMLLLSILSALIWYVTPPQGLSGAAMAFAILLAFYLITPGPAWSILGNAALLTAGTALINLALTAHPPEIVFGMALLLATGNGLGIVGMRQFKLERRRNFLARDEAQRVTEALTLARQESHRRSEYQAWALDALQVGVLLVDPDGRLHTINRRAAELLALPPGSILPGDHHEKLLRLLIDRQDFRDIQLADFRFHIDRLLHGKASATAVRSRSTGKVLEFTLDRLPDQSVAVTIYDASERYALNRRLRHAVEVAGDGFAIYDVNDRVAICSSRFAALYGLSVEQTIGKTFDELVERNFERGVFDRNDRGSGSPAAAGLTRRRMPERVIEMHTMTGEWYLVQERLTPSGDLVTVLTNITARRRIEDELRHSKEEAERTLADLRDAQANLVLAEKMASLGSLVAGMSHEISTPLGIGVSAASHLKEELSRLAEAFRGDRLKRADLEDFLETASEALRIMQGNLGRAARLIQAFKQVSTDQTSDVIRSFDLGEYLREILLSLAPVVRRTPHKVEIESPPGIMVRSRPGALGQIVTNLVMNALQHAFEGRFEPGLLRIKVSEPREGRIAIEFSDDGKGIAMEDLPRVFDPFFTTKRGAGGTGLGLHIVYNLVSQVLGGTVAASSREGEGARFTISFPRDVKG